MPAPRSAQPLGLQLLNNSAPLTEHRDPQTGQTVQAQVTQPWRYLLGQLAAKSPDIKSDWTQTISTTPTQAEIQGLVAQVELLTKQLAGRQ